MIGLLSLLASWRATIALLRVARHHPIHLPPTVYLLGLAAFSCATVGAALILMGRHLFDRVALSERWAPRKAPTPLREGEGRSHPPDSR
jgi:hypothetical protein